MSTYSYTTLTAPVPASTNASGINNSGQIVGYNLETILSVAFGFLYSNGTWTTLRAPPNALNTYPSGINDLGQIVGYYNIPGENTGFLYSNGTWTTLNDPLATEGTSAYGINNSGQIVGSYGGSNGSNGFLYSNGTWTTLDDPLAAEGTYAEGINDSGQIVGYYVDSNGNDHGFLYSNGVWTTLDVPFAGALSTIAYGINNSGQIVGAYEESNGIDISTGTETFRYGGFLYSNGTWTTLNDPYATGSSTYAYGINNLGQIVGSYDGSGFVFGPSVPSDFNRDGYSDILWRNSNGSLAEWLMDGSTITSSPTPTYQGNVVSPDASWSVVGIGDFSGGADILWRQSTTGTLEEWQMNGSTITSSTTPTYQGSAVSPSSTWSVAGVGDFNGEGIDDILWRNTNGSLAEWLMNGSTITSSAAPTYQGSTVSPDPSWSVAGIGDFNDDGTDDILWRNTNGTLTMWLMNGSTITSNPTPKYQGSVVSPDASWSVAGIGYFNGVGDADILWRQSSTGALAMWLMNGSTIMSSGAPTYQGSAVTPDSTWNIVEIGDFNGSSSNSDILWQQSTTGTLVEWQMNGLQIMSTQSVTSQGNAVAPPSTWTSQAKPTDFA